MYLLIYVYDLYSVVESEVSLTIKIYVYDLYSVVESEVSLTIMMNDLNVLSSNDESIIVFLVLHYNGSKTINKNEKQITSLRRCDNIYDVRSKKGRHYVIKFAFYVIVKC